MSSKHVVAIFSPLEGSGHTANNAQCMLVGKNLPNAPLAGVKMAMDDLTAVENPAKDKVMRLHYKLGSLMVEIQPTTLIKLLQNVGKGEALHDVFGAEAVTNNVVNIFYDFREKRDGDTVVAAMLATESSTATVNSGKKLSKALQGKIRELARKYCFQADANVAVLFGIPVGAYGVQNARTAAAYCILFWPPGFFYTVAKAAEAAEAAGWTYSEQAIISYLCHILGNINSDLRAYLRGVERYAPLTKSQATSATVFGGKYYKYFQAGGYPKEWEVALQGVENLLEEWTPMTAEEVDAADKKEWEDYINGDSDNDEDSSGDVEEEEEGATDEESEDELENSSGNEIADLVKGQSKKRKYDASMRRLEQQMQQEQGQQGGTSRGTSSGTRGASQRLSAYERREKTR